MDCRRQRRTRAVIALWTAVALLTMVSCDDDEQTSDPASTEATAEADQTRGAGAETSIEAAALGCLPLDPSGWSRADDRLTLDPVALAANDDAIVATSRLGSQLRFRYSVDGLNWATPTSTPDVLLGRSEHAVAGGPAGFVAVATTGWGGPVVVFSRDGTRWEQIDSASLPTAEVAWLTGVFAGQEGFVIVGGAPADQDFASFVWFSDDGREWTDTGLSARSAAVTATESGWVMLGLEYPDPVSMSTSDAFMRWVDETSTVRVWSSEDGRQWTEVETETSPPGRALLSYMWTAPLTVVDGAWVLALNGATDDSLGPGSPTVWVSTDEGATWSEHRVWIEPDEPGFQIHDTAVIESGLLLAGYQDKPDTAGVEFVHYSSDGMTWQHCWMPDPLELVAMETFGDALVAVTGTGTVYVWSEPNP